MTDSITPAQEARFWTNVDVGGPDSCWPWTGGHDEKGYGHFTIARRWVPAHRVSYLLRFGSIPDKMHVHHLCGVRDCVNPAHLVPLDKPEHSRIHYKLTPPPLPDNSGEHHGMAKLTRKDVVEIRSALADGATQKEMAIRFHVGESAIQKIAARRTWAHV